MRQLHWLGLQLPLLRRALAPFLLLVGILGPAFPNGLNAFGASLALGHAATVMLFGAVPSVLLIFSLPVIASLIGIFGGRYAGHKPLHPVYLSSIFWVSQLVIVPLIVILIFKMFDLERWQVVVALSFALLDYVGFLLQASEAEKRREVSRAILRWISLLAAVCLAFPAAAAVAKLFLMHGIGISEEAMEPLAGYNFLSAVLIFSAGIQVLLEPIVDFFLTPKQTV